MSKKPSKTSFGIPYTQLDWGDYYEDTDYLSFEEHGIYWNLLRRYYTTGPFTQDIKDLKRKMRYEGVESKLLEIMNDFFYLSEEDACWHHKRCDEEIMKVKGTSEVQSQRARKALQAKRRDSSGKFISNNNSSTPDSAGLSPAIKEVIVNNQEEDEEQELRKRLKIQYQELNKDIRDEESRERRILEDVEKEIERLRGEKLKENFRKRQEEARKSQEEENRRKY